MLATGANAKIAEIFQKKYPFITEVIASDKTTYVTGIKKANFLNSRFGTKKYDYIGNALIDLHVWAHSRYCYIASNNKEFIEKVSKIHDVKKVFNRIDSIEY